MKNLFAAYSNEILSYCLGEEASAPQAPETDLAGRDVTRHVQRLERLLTENGRENLVLFGAGCADLLEQAAALCNSLERDLFVCELNPPRARQFRNSVIWPKIAANCGFICDTSPRAILALLSGAGIRIENSVFYLTPGLPEKESGALQACMQLVRRSRIVFTGNGAGDMPGDNLDNTPDNTSGGREKQAGRLSVLAILHPEEPKLDEFCAQIPVEVKELVIVWDSPGKIELPLSAACPIIQGSRDLAGDFAAQRNYALSLCRGSWVLALDGDERLDREGWSEALAAASRPAGDILHDPVCSDAFRPSTIRPNVNAYFLPRLTLFPDERHFRAGFGLWPDYQLRLFRRTEKTFFARPVHEILTGASGASAILQHAPLWHLSYILKDRKSLEERLEVFNQAMGRNAHRLNRDYPRLPLDWFRQFLSLCPDLKYILLPE